MRDQAEASEVDMGVIELDQAASEVDMGVMELDQAEASEVDMGVRELDPGAVFDETSFQQGNDHKQIMIIKICTKSKATHPNSVVCYASTLSAMSEKSDLVLVLW